MADLDARIAEINALPNDCDVLRMVLHALTVGITESDAEIAELKAERDEALRRRDAWRAKAEGYDAVRLALREKVGTPQPPHMSRLLWAGIAAGEKKRADDAASELAALRKAARSVVRAYQEASPMRMADMHQESCGCLRCEIDRLNHVTVS